MKVAVVKVLSHLLCFFLCILISLHSARADNTSPGSPLEFFQSRGAHSFDGLFGVPTPLPPIVPTDQWQLSFGHSNMFAVGVGQNTLVVLDGERSRLALSWTHVLSNCLRSHIDVPIIAHAGGYFDSAIQHWHDLFQLPNANREETPTDLLNLVYVDPAGESLRLDSAVAEHGDVSVALLWSLGCGSDTSAATETPVVRFGLKLPTGRLSALTGSGEADLFVDVTSTTHHWGNWSGRASGGFILLGQSEVLSTQEEAAAFGALALGWQVTPRFKPIIQIDWHSALFESTMRELGRFTALATVGFQWRHSKRVTSEFAFLEDIVPDASPDIGLHYGLRYDY